MTQPLRCVPDASVAVKLFIDEALSERAAALFAHLAVEPAAQLSAPDLLFIECTNVLWKHTRRSGYPVDRARQAVRDLGSLAVQWYPTADLIRPALEIAIQHGITAYDASYIALARELRLPMVTADEKLARALAGTALEVHWLGDFPIPPLPAAA
jgi:predicted nucleic acid-binding protein